MSLDDALRRARSRRNQLLTIKSASDAEVAANAQCAFVQADELAKAFVKMCVDYDIKPGEIHATIVTGFNGRDKVKKVGFGWLTTVNFLAITSEGQWIETGGPGAKPWQPGDSISLYRTSWDETFGYKGRDLHYISSWGRHAGAENGCVPTVPKHAEFDQPPQPDVLLADFLAELLASWGA